MGNPNTSIFPNAIAGDSDLPPASNSFSTSLTGTVNSSVTTLPVVTTTGCNVPCILRIENEIVLATGKTSNTFTGCTRGFDGSSAVSHNSGAVVSNYIFDWHFNQLASEVKAIETLLGINGSNVVLAGAGGTPIVYRAAVAQAGVGVLGFNGPTGSTPSVGVYESGATVYGVAQFAVGQSVQDHFIVPSTFSGNLFVSLRWRAVAITGACNWTLSFAGVGSGDILDATFGTTGVVTPSPAGTTKQVVQTAITGFDISSLAANKDCFFKLKRDSAGDTMTGNAELFSIRFLLS